MNYKELLNELEECVNIKYFDKELKGRIKELRDHDLTFADLLGWEVGAEYADEKDFRYRLKEPNELQTTYSEVNGKWYVNASPWSGKEIDRLRNATKCEPKYYAKVKGWELIENSKAMHWNYYLKGDAVFISNSDNTDTYKAILTKAEWNELGINDSNADFEEVLGI